MSVYPESPPLLLLPDPGLLVLLQDGNQASLESGKKQIKFVSCYDYDH
jgi:hypothetical protein